MNGKIRKYGFYLLFCLLGAFLMVSLCWSHIRFATPVSTSAQEPELNRLATSALRRIGIEDQKAVFVTREKELPDGSFLVKIMLESGKTVEGRLYKDRAREKISIDKSSLFEHKIIVVKESPK